MEYWVVQFAFFQSRLRCLKSKNRKLNGLFKRTPLSPCMLFSVSTHIFSEIELGTLFLSVIIGIKINSNREAYLVLCWNKKIELFGGGIVFPTTGP